ncbi:MAG: replicative DNA helicase [Agriterribacter sp.]
MNAVAKIKNSKKVEKEASLVFAKVPPQATEIENAVLGAIMLRPGAFDKVRQILQPEHFYTEANKSVFKAFINLVDARCPIDILTTVERLKTNGDLETAGGAYGVAKLTNAVVSDANIDAHARIIYDRYLLREMIVISGEVITAAYQEGTDPHDLLNEYESKLSSLAISKTIKPYKSLASIAKEALNQIYEVRNSKNEMTGVPCGISSIDAVTQGWQPTNLIILAARPGIGKSALAANFARNAAQHPEKPTAVGVFSLEMSSVQWALRILSAESELEMYDLKRGRVTDNDMRKLEEIAYGQFEGTRIFFDETPNLDIYALKAKARVMVLKEGVGLLIIDYLQLMSAKRSATETREQEVSKISRELKQLAKELNVPIIALCQLSRQGDNSDPKLSNLRESGAIEQDADDVFFLVEVPEEDIANDASLKDCIVIKVGKHRNGTSPDITVRFVKEIQKLMSDSEYDRYTGGANRGWRQLPNPDKNIETNRKDETPF